MGVNELVLIRHGESQGNVAAAEAHAADAHEIDVPARDADVVLSELGRRQAKALGVALGAMSAETAPQALVVSPYLRARRRLASPATRRASICRRAWTNGSGTGSWAFSTASPSPG